MAKAIYRADFVLLRANAMNEQTWPPRGARPRGKSASMHGQSSKDSPTAQLQRWGKMQSAHASGHARHTTGLTTLVFMAVYPT